MFGLLDGLASHNPQIISSLTNGNRSALLGEFSVLNASGSVYLSPVLPLATQAFGQSKASLTGSPTPVASFAFTSSEIFPAISTMPLASGSAVFLRFYICLALPEEEQVLLPSIFWELDTA